MPSNRAILAVLAGGWLLAATGAASAAVSREDIVIMSADGRHYTSYTTLRSTLPRRQYYLPAGTTPEDYLYIHPSEFRRQATHAGMRLTFPGGGYALMRTGRFGADKVTVKDNGLFVFDSWTGEKLPNGHFGKWNAPEPFSEFAFVWVAPDGFEIVSYASNRQGQWRQVGHTLIWTGEDVNNITFRISYRRTDEQQAPAASTTGERQRITLEAGITFAPASHKLTEQGLAAIDQLARRIKQAQPARVIVTGHTDNQPVAPYLRDEYPSNWELSAARATNVVRKLIDRGVNPDILVARARGSQEPVATNNTAEGRARNRRIEVVMITAGASAAESRHDPGS